MKMLSNSSYVESSVNGPHADSQVYTQVKVFAPSEIKVRLVRDDHHSTSNVFRGVFEISQMMSSILFGVIISAAPTKLHWIFFGVTCFFSILFLYLSIWFSKRARLGS